METVLKQITDNNAHRLLQDLENLHILKVLKKHTEPEKKLSEKFAGKLNLTDEQYEQFQQHIADSRKEWERDI